MDSSPDSPAAAPSTRTLRASTFLAPRLEPAYAEITRALADELGVRPSLAVGDDPSRLASGELDLAFLCGLLYTELRDAGADIEALGAPVFAAARYEDRPMYFSDIVVRRADPARSLEDLAGRTFAFNERGSHSGYNALAAELVARGIGEPFFGAAVETGGHERSLCAVLDATVDTAAIDSQVLEVAFEQDAELFERLRVIEAIGPSPAPPLVAGSALEVVERERLRSRMASTRSKMPAVRRWVAVADSDYDPIREMRALTRSRVRL